MNKKFYITTAIDYTNDVIHIGHAYQKIMSDVLARYHRLIGDNTFFLTGTDEHGSTNEQAAKKAGKSPKKYVDEISKEDKRELDALNISYDRFIRTTDSDHKETVKEFYLKVKENGDIYKGVYKGLYCVGCESYKTESEIVDGKCILHPTRVLEEIEEENYFFRWSKYQGFLKKHISDNPGFIRPDQRKKDMLGFLSQGLEDITISRQKDKVSWGIPTPDDSNHVIYVWFDALINYISGAPNFWPADIHVLGKDNVRWHALLWPAMLKSAGYPLPKTIYGHAFLTLDGQRISKSLGNVIRPSDLVRRFSVDGVRYYFIRYGPWIEDVDISLEKIKGVYNADLANGLGNLVSRFAKLCESIDLTFASKKKPALNVTIRGFLDNYRFDYGLVNIWNRIDSLNKKIDLNKLWENTADKKEVILDIAEKIRQIAYDLKPFLPETSEKIEKQFKGPNVKSEKPLFPRLK